MAWREDHHRIRIPLHDIAEGFDQSRFFAVHRRSADDDGRGAVAFEDYLKMADYSDGLGRHDVELEIAADRNAIRRRADFDEATAIDFGLGQEAVHVAQHGGDQRTPLAITREGAVGDASVYNQHACTGLACQSKEVRPELSFGDHDHFRTKGLEIAADSEGEIEWKVEDVLGAKAIVRESLSGSSGGGDHDTVFGILF